MKVLNRTGLCLSTLAAALGAVVALQPAAGWAQDANPPAAPLLRDGAHDFDFNFGVWRTDIRREVHPLSGSAETTPFTGTVTVRKVWGGRGWLEEIAADGPTGHWEGATLFLYNPQSHQWSQNFAGEKSGVMNAPTIGSFHDGRGELYAQDTLDGRSILVRGVWSDITPDAHNYVESYSGDGGRTWEPVFIAHLTRLKP
jgi:hypothetical protein